MTNQLSLWVMLLFTGWLVPCLATAQDKVADSHGIGKKSVLEIEQEVLDNLSDEEQDWYQTFHDGILFFDGWASISQDILEIYPLEKIDDTKPMVQRIGVKIGTEWCKINTVRKIDNTMLRQWGSRLRASIAVGPESTTRTLQEIEQEVDLLLKPDDKLSFVTPQS